MNRSELIVDVIYDDPDCKRERYLLSDGMVLEFTACGDGKMEQHMHAGSECPGPACERSKSVTTFERGDRVFTDSHGDVRLTKSSLTGSPPLEVKNLKTPRGFKQPYQITGGPENAIMDSATYAKELGAAMKILGKKHPDLVQCDCGAPDPEHVPGGTKCRR